MVIPRSIRKIRSMVGEMIPIYAPTLYPDGLINVKLHAIDASGLWVEYQGFNLRMLKQFDMSMSKSTLITFIPYQNVHYIIQGISQVALSEEALGLWEVKPGE